MPIVLARQQGGGRVVSRPMIPQLGRIETRARGDFACVTQDCPDCNCPADGDHPLAVLLKRQAESRYVSTESED